MTDTQKEQFKKEIYDAFNNAWFIIQNLKEADKTDGFWVAWDKKCEEFKDKYTSELGESLYRVLIDAGHIAGRIINEV